MESHSNECEKLHPGEPSRWLILERAARSRSRSLAPAQPCVVCFVRVLADEHHRGAATRLQYALDWLELLESPAGLDGTLGMSQGSMAAAAAAATATALGEALAYLIHGIATAVAAGSAELAPNPPPMEQATQRALKPSSRQRALTTSLLQVLCQITSRAFDLHNAMSGCCVTSKCTQQISRARPEGDASTLETVYLVGVAHHCASLDGVWHEMRAFLQFFVAVAQCREKAGQPLVAMQQCRFGYRAAVTGPVSDLASWRERLGTVCRDAFEALLAFLDHELLLQCSQDRETAIEAANATTHVLYTMRLLMQALGAYMSPETALSCCTRLMQLVSHRALRCACSADAANVLSMSSVMCQRIAKVQPRMHSENLFVGWRRVALSAPWSDFLKRCIAQPCFLELNLLALRSLRGMLQVLGRVLAAAVRSADENAVLWEDAEALRISGFADYVVECICCDGAVLEKKSGDRQLPADTGIAVQPGASLAYGDAARGPAGQTWASPLSSRRWTQDAPQPGRLVTSDSSQLRLRACFQVCAVLPSEELSSRSTLLFTLCCHHASKLLDEHGCRAPGWSISRGVHQQQSRFLLELLTVLRKLVKTTGIPCHEQVIRQFAALVSDLSQQRQRAGIGCSAPIRHALRGMFGALAQRLRIAECTRCPAADQERVFASCLLQQLQRGIGADQGRSLLETLYACDKFRDLVESAAQVASAASGSAALARSFIVETLPTCVLHRAAVEASGFADTGTVTALDASGEQGPSPAASTRHREHQRRVRERHATGRMPAVDDDDDDQHDDIVDDDGDGAGGDVGDDDDDNNNNNNHVFSCAQTSVAPRLWCWWLIRIWPILQPLGKNLEECHRLIRAAQHPILLWRISFLALHTEPSRTELLPAIASVLHSLMRCLCNLPCIRYEAVLPVVCSEDEARTPRRVLLHDDDDDDASTGDAASSFVTGEALVESLAAMRTLLGYTAASSPSVPCTPLAWYAQVQRTLLEKRARQAVRSVLAQPTGSQRFHKCFAGRQPELFDWLDALSVSRMPESSADLFPGTEVRGQSAQTTWKDNVIFLWMHWAGSRLPVNLVSWLLEQVPLHEWMMATSSEATEAVSESWRVRAIAAAIRQRAAPWRHWRQVLLLTLRTNDRARFVQFADAWFRSLPGQCWIAPETQALMDAIHRSHVLPWLVNGLHASLDRPGAPDARPLQVPDTLHRQDYARRMALVRVAGALLWDELRQRVRRAAHPSGTSQLVSSRSDLAAHLCELAASEFALGPADLLSALSAMQALALTLVQTDADAGDAAERASAYLGHMGRSVASWLQQVSGQDHDARSPCQELVLVGCLGFVAIIGAASTVRRASTLHALRVVTGAVAGGEPAASPWCFWLRILWNAPPFSRVQLLALWILYIFLRWRVLSVENAQDLVLLHGLGCWLYTEREAAMMHVRDADSESSQSTEEAIPWAAEFLALIGVLSAALVQVLESGTGRDANLDAMQRASATSLRLLTTSPGDESAASAGTGDGWTKQELASTVSHRLLWHVAALVESPLHVIRDAERRK